MRIRTYLAAAGLMIGLAGPALAAEDIMPPKEGDFTLGGSFALTSEYFFRAITQSDDAPAVQGGLTAGYDFGPVAVSAGVWASNVDFGAADAQNAAVEMDWTAGLSGKLLDDKLSWSIGGIYYTYPGANSQTASEYDFVEGTVGLGYDFDIFSVGVTYNYSPDFFANSGNAHYVNGKVTVPVKYVDLVAAVGRQTIENNVAFAGPDYVDYKLAVVAKVWGFDVEAAFIDTNKSTFNGAALTTYADNQFLFTVSKSF